MKARLIVVYLVTSFVLAAPAFAQGRPDQQLADEIAANVRNYSRFGIFDHVAGRVDDGVVVLTGKVTMPYKKQDIERRVARLDGVREVRSEITVLPVSIQDDELRYRVSRAIYGNPTFWNYAGMAHPPIHIIVENGRITLTGCVNSEVEKTLAYALAQVEGSFGVKNELRIDKR